jgi:hypothetical protein
MKYLVSIESETEYSVADYESKLNRMLGHYPSMREFVKTKEWNYFKELFEKWYVEVHTYVEPAPEPEPVPVPVPEPVVVPEPTPEPEPVVDYDKRGLDTPYGNDCITDDQC